MPHPSSAEALVRTLDEALELLRDYRPTHQSNGVPDQPLPTLLEQCEAALGAIPGPVPLRTIHHFACTGGTLISKALSALPNTVLLSEIDPLSEMTPPVWPKMPFCPTDVIFAMRNSVRPVGTDVVTHTFLAAIMAAHDGVERLGQHLILRDHAHSQFCRNGVDFDARPTLREMLADHVDLLSVVTVRHPLDSFLSLDSFGWVNFAPGTLDTYAARYLAFLDRHDGLPVVRYEDFVTAPEAVLERLCTILGLTPSPLVFDLIPVIRLSGDSGRNEGPIAPRPRRPVPEAIDAERFTSRSYHMLCMRLEYEL